MSAYPTNNSESAVSEILAKAREQVVNTTKSFAPTYKAIASPETGSYWLRVIFFMLLFGFIIFTILIFIHFVFRPIFIFNPGSKGIITVPMANDNLTYWNKKMQPPASSFVPVKDDLLASYHFLNNFSFSIDLFVTKVTSTNPTTRLILYKAKPETQPLKAPTKSLIPAPASSSSEVNVRCSAIPEGDKITTLQEFINYMSFHSSMIMYLNDTNDLTVTIFSGNGQMYSVPYIKNIPLYMPFRITVVVETNMFTVYFNGKQTFQRIISSKIRANIKNSGSSPNERFYSAPEWANSPSKSVFLQNFNVWPRVITYDEVLASQPALALESDFNVGGSISNTASCNS
jgi:hypothetical protein